MSGYDNSSYQDDGGGGGVRRMANGQHQAPAEGFDQTGIFATSNGTSRPYDENNHNGLINSHQHMFSPHYFPQARPSIGDNKSVFTLTIKPLPHDDQNHILDEDKQPAGSPLEKGGCNTEDPEQGEQTGRDQWGKGIEFLMSCIAMSVGLGNVWRFPFACLENGGGAFLIPYLICLLVIGRPIYFLEMCVGQFSSRGSVKVYDLAPAMRGKCVGKGLAGKNDVLLRLAGFS